MSDIIEFKPRGKCQHLTTTEAYASADGVEWQAIPGFLCTWPCGRFPVSPVWVDKRIGGGNKVDPHHDCPSCPCFERSKPSEKTP